MAHRIHNQAEVDIGLRIGLNILSAFQHHLRQKKQCWTEENMFGWTVIGSVLLYKKEDITNYNR